MLLVAQELAEAAGRSKAGRRRLTCQVLGDARVDGTRSMRHCVVLRHMREQVWRVPCSQLGVIHLQAA